MPKALISVTDKTGVVELAQALSAQDFDILSTGGTARVLRDGGINVTDIETFTGSPEMLEGRVKTLHPRVFGGILGRPDVDEAEFQHHALEAIDLVVVNLYEFSQTVRRPGSTPAEIQEAIDIGGVSLLRAAAKNYQHVLVAVDPADYSSIVERLQQGTVDESLRKDLAAKAFRATAAYDSAIAQYLTDQDDFPERLNLSYERTQTLRYGENPHQAAAFYQQNTPDKSAFTQLQGKELSYNNIADTSAAIHCLQGVSTPACAIVKHANPCGMAIGSSLIDAYQRAFRTDPTSAFGGIVAFNHELNANTLRQVLDNQFAEVVVAPAVTDDATHFAKTKKNLRLIAAEQFASPEPSLSVKSVANGLLAQQLDTQPINEDKWKSVTNRPPTSQELIDLRFAWRVVKHVKSNAIVFVRDGATIGIGAGQPNRVVSVRIAAMRMQEERLDDGSFVMASDAFFPFADGIENAADAGVTAVIQPGGSIRDEEIIAACNERDIAMIVTGTRHFNH